MLTTQYRARVIGVLILFSILQPNLQANRAAFWKPERTLGSSLFSMDSLQWLLLPEQAGPEFHYAMEDFEEVMRLRGIEYSVMDNGEREPKNSLTFIRGDTGILSANSDAFSLIVSGSRVRLIASSEAGWINGLYAMCHEVLGARWYWQGELGFELLDGGVGRFPKKIWREQPAYAQRALYPVNSDFGRRNRLNRSFSFNHNLARVFTEEVFRDYPEVFAEIGGKRQKPEGSGAKDPQPDFTEPRTVELATRAARDHFLRNPESNSFSLSINDNSLFDEGAETEAIIRGLGLHKFTSAQDAGQEVGKREGEIHYFRGRPNYTDLVFGFMNAVAEEVFADSEMLETPSGEERYLTALAYYSTEQSPSFEIHPRVMPVLTSDRAQWHNLNYRTEDKALIERWAESGAERIATWDYYFGAPYPYPRQFNRWIGESIKFLHEEGIDVFFSQLPSVWGLDGPKAWLTAQLLWDPKQDVGELLSEFYTNFFGAAAGPIREFYELAEETRNQREGEAEWIKFYKDEAGIELFGEATLQAMRSLIESAEELVRDDARRSARVEIVSEAFSFTETYAEFHSRRIQLVERCIASLNGSAADAEDLFDLFRSFKLAERDFEQLKDWLVEEPMHRGFVHFDRIEQSNPKGLFLAALANCEAPDSPGPELSALLEALEPWKPDRQKFESLGKNPLLAHQGSELRNFLGPEIPKIEGWSIDYRASEGLSLVAIDGAAANGLRIENADIVSLDQTFPIISGKHYMLEVEVAWKVSPDNRTWLQLVWEDISGETLRTEVALRIPRGGSNGVQRLTFVLDPPTNAYDLKVGIVANRQYSGDFLELRKVDFGILVP